MSTLRIYDASLDSVGSTLRVYEASLTADDPTGASVLRVYDVSLSTTGNPPALTAVIDPVGTVPGGTVVTLTVTVNGGYDNIVWTIQDSSPVVTFAGDDLRKVFTAPYSPDQQDFLVSVVAVNTAGASNTLLLSVTIAPWLEWRQQAGVWVPTGISRHLGG